MSKYNYFYLFWLIPGFFLFLMLHQIAVFYGIADTFENGTSYTAEIVEFELKQIGAQTSGYVVLKFETKSDGQIQQKLSLPVEMAGKLQGIRIVPIRYQKDAFQDIVMIPTYETQKGLALTNTAIAFVGLIITVFIGFAVNRYVKKKHMTGDRELVIERIDDNDDE